MTKIPPTNRPHRRVLYVSDRTGLTAESYGKSLLAQFPDREFETRRYGFVDTPEKVAELAKRIAREQAEIGERLIVFSTLVEEQAQHLVESSGACVIDLFNTFIGPLEDELGTHSAHTLGMSHDVFGDTAYQRRLDAIDFSLAHDDGVRTDQYAEADVILVGVSRSGKTPTSLYLAMNFSIKACNYPLTDRELESDRLPESLRRWTRKLAGLTIDPEALNAIREKRRASDHYCAPDVCRREVQAAEALFRYAGIPVFDTTNTSIEELASGIIKRLQLTRS